MHASGYAYGNWGLAATMVAITLFFLFRYIPLRTRLGRRSGGALSAFIVALFVEMYGFPLTIYLLSHWVGLEIPMDHINGHLLGDLITYLGLGDGWFIVMALSNLLIILGMWLVFSGWDRVYRAQGQLVTDGVYAYIRHPQYTGLFIITLGFMIQWPTLATLILWPFVISMYVRLARREERDVLETYPLEYADYMKRTPMFFPRLIRPASHDRPQPKTL